MNGRRVLGRGLDSLIPQAPGATTTTPPTAPTAIAPPIGTEIAQVHWIPVEQIVPNPRQPRTLFNDEKLQDLARSIQEKGILEPLIVRPLDGGGYELVAGERRLRAAQLIGRAEVPVLFRTLDDRASLEIALIENLQREDLNPVDEARAYQKLAEDFGRTHADISREVGKDRSTITNLLRILRLPDTLLDEVSRGTLSVGHARVLLALEDRDEQLKLGRRMVDEGWSVRQAERHLAERAGDRPKKQAPAVPQRDRQVVRIEEALQYALGTQVVLTHGAKGGKIEIRYFSDEELERVLEVIGIEIR